jgi:hypothetical protein
VGRLHIAAAAQVLGGGVHHHVTAQVQRALQHGRRKGIVGNRACASLAGHLRQGGNVHALQERVAGGFNPDDAGIGLQRGLHPIQLRHVDKAGADLPFGEQVLEHVGGAVVDVARRHHMVAGLQALENGGHGGQA